jgi:hypothetical protein
MADSSIYDFFDKASDWIRDSFGMGSDDLGKLRSWHSKERASAADRLGDPSHRGALKPLCKRLRKDRSSAVTVFSRQSSR